MKKLLAIVTVLSLAISGSALAATAAKGDQAAPSAKSQQNSKSKTKVNNTVEKKKSGESKKS